jgi:hypothetical protein
MTTTRTPASTRFAAPTVVALLAAAALSIGTASVALAGGPPPPADGFELEAVYINCVDDEVDEPGIDGDALVRVRLYNNSLGDVQVIAGPWAVVSEGVTLDEGTFIVPAAVDADAMWEQVVRIDGGTGAAWFEASVDVNNGFGTTTIELEPSLGVPGDCEQPDEPGEETPPPVEDTPATTATPGAGQATPRFTG